MNLDDMQIGETKDLEVTVGNTSVRNFKGTNYYSFVVGEKNGTWFRTNKIDTGVKKNDIVSFTFEKTKWGNEVDTNTLKVIGKAEPPAKGKSTGGKGASDWKDKENYWAEKAEKDVVRDKVISYQAAWNTSVNLVSTAIKLGIFPIVEDPKTKAAKGKAYDVYVEAVRKQARELLNEYLVAPDFVVNNSIDEGNSAAEEEENPYGDNLDD